MFYVINAKGDIGMNRIMKKAAAAAVSAAVFIQGFTAISVYAMENYICDLTSLVSGGADTYYGETDDIIELDKYTTAYLTYEGTYVSADGKVYLKSGTVSNGDGKYKKGSYIEFYAPYDGTLTVTGTDIGWFEGDSYIGYNVGSMEVTADTVYHFGYRKDTTYIESISYTPDENAADEITNGYDEDVIAGYQCRVKAQQGKPAVIYLSSGLRYGTDNTAQLYDAKYMFDMVGDNATLAAPQAENGFSDISAFVSELRDKYDADSVTVIGQSESASSALESGADRIITIAGAGETVPDADVWAFSAYGDDAMADVRSMVNTFRASGCNVRYTEYPFEADKINHQAAAEHGLLEWILNGAEDSRIVDVVLFAGQSNMAGRGDYDEAEICPSGYGYEYHAVTEPGVLSSVTEPFGKYENNDSINDSGSDGNDRRSGDMVSSLMKSYYEATGVPMVGVQASRGGQATDYFLSDSVMSEMQRRFNDAVSYLNANGYTVRNKMLVWCQGEADADKKRSDEAYKSNTLKIFNELKDGCGIDDVFIVKTGHYNIYYGIEDGGEPSADALAADAEYLRISSAQQTLADENENIYVASSLYSDEYLGRMRDRYHYYQDVYNSVGADAGEYIAKIYGGGDEDNGDTDTEYSWDFETDQTAVSGVNVPVISGTASYDSANKNIKLDSDTRTDGKVSVSLSPAAKGVVTAEFDMMLAKLSGLTHQISVSDSDGTMLMELSFDAYNSTGSLKINGAEIAADNEITQYINSYRGDGMSAEKTHFCIEVNYPKKVLTLNITKNDNEKGSFTGSISSSGSLSEFSISSVHSKYTSGRASYVDNISLRWIVPGNEMYVTGPSYITKRMGMTVTQQYELSKTYSDDREKTEWSVSGVEGVTIDKDTGVLSVAENADVGEAVITAELVSGGTLPTGTRAEMTVEIRDFADISVYDISGSRTVETGKKTKFAIERVTDNDGNDITEFAKLTDISSDNSSVADISSDGTLEAVSAGTANITAKLIVEKTGDTVDILIPVKVGKYEVESAESRIDITDLISYGTDRYRVYSSDGSYEEVTASGGTVENNTGGTAVVVPVYSLDLTSGGNGTAQYTPERGYGLVSEVDYKTDENGSMPLAGNPVMMNIPDGFYDITVSRTGGVRCDVYAGDMQIINNTTSSGSQNRPSESAVMKAPAMALSGGGLDLTIGNTSGSNERISGVVIAKVPDKYRKNIIWIAGDSESANYYPVDADGDDLENDKIMMTGFGMQLSRFMSDKYDIANFGQPSATVKTWYDECFESVLKGIQPGDLLLIDFGINDAVSSSNKISVDEMKEYMSMMISAVRSKGADAVLVSPVYNNKYQSKSYFTYQNGNNEMYDFASENDIACIDLNRGTMMYTQNAADQTGDASWTEHNYHVGDNLHLTQHSAVLAAAVIAGGLKELGYETTDYSYNYSDISSVNDTLRGEETGVVREYSISALKDYITVCGAVNKKVTMSYDGTAVTVHSNGSGIKNAVLSAVNYSGDGSLKSIKLYDIDLSSGECRKDIEAEDGTVLYLWNSMSEMIPLTEKFICGSVQVTEPAVQTAAPTSKPTDIPTSSPVVLYEQDFEGYETGSSGGWESSAGSVEVKIGAENGIGKYMAVTSLKSGTCRSGLVELPNAITENFVFECDFKSSRYDNVSELQLVERKGSVYMNHGVYSNAFYALTMDRPRNSDLYVINNGRSDSGLSIDAYNEPAVTSTEITGDPWLHIKAVGNFDTKTIILYITSLDGKTEYYRGMTDMSKELTSWKCIHLLSPSTGVDTCIDNIRITKATEQELSMVYHDVTLKLKSYEARQYVENGRYVRNIPDVSVYGEYFEGWRVNGEIYSSEELSKLPITSDCVIEGIVSGDYIEALGSVSFNSYPAADELIMGADENTYGDNIISLSITGEQGTSLVTNPDSRVLDYSIEWEFDGFRVLDGRPTGETGDIYCDSYGLCEVTERAQSAVNFKIKRTAANYYGRVTAKVTYNGKTIEISRPLVLLGDKTAESGVLMPWKGYTSDFNKYDSALLGYTFTEQNTLFPGWKLDGSDSSRYIFMGDDTGMFLRLTRDAVGNSAYGYNEIGDIKNETVFEQDVRFNADGSIQYTGGRVTSVSSVAFTLSMDNSKLLFNGKEICSAEKGVWYHACICIDPGTKKAWAMIYSNDELKGESGTVDFADSDYTGGAYYRINPSKVKNGSIDINNVVIKQTEVSDIEITAPETVQIPENGTCETDISLSALTSDGYQTISAAKWSVDDIDDVEIESTGDRSAKLIIGSGAPSGEVVVKASVGGKTETFSIKLLGTKDNIAFKEAPAGAMIPLSGTAQYKYSAVVRNGMAEDIEGRDISYDIYSDSGDLSGITMSGDGVLSVSSDAEPQSIYVRAVSDDISRSIKVSVYNLKFDMNSNSDNFTPVNGVSYSDALGYGIDNAVSDTEYTFKARLERGKAYSVKAVYSGTIRCESIDGFSDGFERTRETAGEDNFNVAVFGDDVLDISVSGTLERVEIEPVERTGGVLPDWWTIGDSTVQQNGSWGYTIASSETSDFSKYPALNGVIDTFHNSGRAGRHHKSYYNEGLFNELLCSMKPGDVVSISGMGTNDSSSSMEQFKQYNEIYINAIIDMGGYVILGSYTPSGNYGSTAGKVYDSDTMTFRGMRTESYDRAIREVYEERKGEPSILGFIDIGAMADAKMTEDVRKAYNDTLAQGESAARNAAAERAAEMMAWWKDYNHYYTDFSDYILPEITEAAAELIKSIE